jgi:uncharacterized protein (TIGR02246 family)
MKTKWAWLAAAGLLAAVATGFIVAQEKKAATQGAASQREADEAAIRASVEAFVKAYNAHDAKAIAALFLPEGQMVDEEGNTAEGHEAITEVFSEVFAETPEAQIEVTVDSVRFIGTALAVEVGATKMTPAPGETPEYGRYTALHVKRDGKWLMAVARDTEGEPSTNHERLLPLAWLIGEWIDESEDSVVFTSCRWSEDKNFILQDLNVQMAGKNAMKVTQRIGWDPLSKRMRSWVFDSEGGFGEGAWARSGDAWVIKATGVTAEGAAASATNVVMPLGKDSYLFRSGDRVIGDEVMPPIEVKIVRKPPAPTGSKQ